MVTVLEHDSELRQRAWDAAASVVDPEIPVLTIADLGVLRDVVLDGDHVEVAITPTYSGCPAMNMIALEIEVALERAGFREPKVRTVLSPAWTTDWMSEEGRRKLHAYGIAPPQASQLASRAVRRAGRRVPAMRLGEYGSSCPNSARPPARRSGAASPAANPSIISSVIDHVSSRTALPSPDRQRPPPRGVRCRLDDLRHPRASLPMIMLSRPASISRSAPRSTGRRCAAPIRSAPAPMTAKSASP